MTDPRVRFLSGIEAAHVGDVVALLDTPTIRITMTSTSWSDQVLL